MALRDAWSEVKDKALVLGVSPDSIKSHSNFIAKKELPFALISDPDHELTEAMGFWGLKKFMGKEYMGVNRSTIVFDEDGKVKAILDKVKVKTHVEDLLAVLD